MAFWRRTSRRLSMLSLSMLRLKMLRLNVLLALAVAGVAVASYLSWVALDAEREAACGPLGDCHAVQSSSYAEVAGVPVALLGAGMYGALLLLIGARRLWSAAPPVIGVWMFALALGGTLYSAYLSYLELFVIEAICAWCVVSAALVTAILLLCVPELRAARELRAATGAAGGSGPSG